MIASRLSFIERAKSSISPMAQRLLRLMDDKRTNLALSADVTTSEDLLMLADQLGPEICVLKTHIDIITDFTPALTQRLTKLAQEHHFLIFEDRKFADIGHTVKQQYEGGMYHIANWADMVNAHALPGPGIIQGLASIGRAKNRGLLLLAEMSSKGHLMDEAYAQQTLAMAKQYPDFVFGFITQHALTSEPQWINMTPGVQLEPGTDNLGQQYNTPESAIIEHGTDIIIVGRGITKASNPKACARDYRHRGFRAYETKIGAG